MLKLINHNMQSLNTKASQIFGMYAMYPVSKDYENTVHKKVNRVK